MKWGIYFYIGKKNKYDFSVVLIPAIFEGKMSQAFSSCQTDNVFSYRDRP